MPERMNPKNDFVFQMIFGREENQDILLCFLNAIFKLSLKQKLTEIQILKSNLDQEYTRGKSCILDICAKTAAGIQINVKVQLGNRYNIEKRTLYQWSRLFFSQLSAGKDYRNLKKTIYINIFDFEYLPLDLYHSVFHLREDQKNYMLTDILEVHFIELPKLYKENWDPEDPLINWILFLNSPTDENLEILSMKEPAIRKAWAVLDLLSQDEEARRLYDLREKALHDEVSMLAAAKDEGKAEVARNLLKKGMDLAFISETTGLPEGEIKRLKSELNS